MHEIGDKVTFEFKGEKYRGFIIHIMNGAYDVEMARGVTMIIDKEWIIT